MVQTEQQYICIHQCLLAVLEGKENIISPPREIHDNQGYEGRAHICLIPFLHTIFIISYTGGKRVTNKQIHSLIRDTANHLNETK